MEKMTLDLDSCIAKVTLLVMDVDGTLTDGGLYWDSNAVESKKFSVKDGAGIIFWKKSGFIPMILTGRTSECTAIRASDLGIEEIFQKVPNKVAFLQRYLAENDLEPEQIAYIGDDLNDLGAIALAGVSACPADACMEVLGSVDFIMEHRGGEGAVREFIELLLKRKGLWRQVVESPY